VEEYNMAKDIIITPLDGDIVFDNSSGTECGSITQDGDNLVISNAVGDVLLGDGASDIYIGDGTNNVDILFEQSGAIKAEDGSTGVTLTIGSGDTTLVLESPTLNTPALAGASTINNTLTLTTTNGKIIFDYEAAQTGEYTTEVPLLQIDRSGTPITILSRASSGGAIVLGADDMVHIAAGDTKTVVKDNLNMSEEQVVFSSEAGFTAYGFPSNDTSWANRNEFRFRSDSGTSSENGLYIGDGGNTQFIDVSRNLSVVNADISGNITASGNISASGTGLFGMVGIGKTNPAYSLDCLGNFNINGTNQVNLRCNNANVFNGYTTQTMINSYGLDRPIVFTLNQGITEAMRIAGTTGNVGIGTSAPTAKLHVVGDALITGKITAQEFHTEFVSASIIYQSGSTKFGDTSDDVHSFSGSLRVTGSGDHYFTDGNVGIGTTSPSAKLHVVDGAESLYFSSSLGNNFRGVNLAGTNPSVRLDGSGDTFILSALGTGLAIWDETAVAYRLNILNNGNVGIGTGTPTAKLHVAGNILATTNITASGNISASGQVYLGDKLYINNKEALEDTGTTLAINQEAHFTSGVQINRANGPKQITLYGNVTASANISASGDITAGGNLSTKGDLASIGSGLIVRTVNDAGQGTSIPQPTSTLAVVGDLFTTSHITASGNISASGTIIGGALQFIGTDTSENATHYLTFKKPGNTLTNITNGFSFNPSTDSLALGGVIYIAGQAGTITGLNSLTSVHITASGNISASGQISGLG
jgi:hypothetical protein